MCWRIPVRKPLLLLGMAQCWRAPWNRILSPALPEIWMALVLLAVWVAGLVVRVAPEGSAAVLRAEVGTEGDWVKKGSCKRVDLR